MTVDPDIQALLARTAGGKPLEAMTLEEARAAADGLKQLQGPAEEVAAVTDITVSADDGYAIPVRLYRPIRPTSDPVPLMVFAHGGGWFRCTLDQYDNPSRALANATGCIVASADYRLAPEHKFPVPLEDIYAVLRWAAENARLLGADPGKLVVAGDSAGGNLAAAAALVARDRGGPALAHQLLLYPVTNFAFDTPSYAQFGSRYMLTRAAMEACWAYYLARPEDGAGPYASPLRAPSLAGLPAATVITAGFDPLRDEGEAYAHRLREAGVAVRLERLPGMIHACIHMLGVAPAARRLFDLSADAVRAALARKRAA